MCPSSLPSVSRTIATFTAVVALTLAACGSGTNDTTTTEGTRGWSDEAFRDLMTYCQATAEFDSCANLLISMRDTNECSVEATYRIIDHLENFDTSDEREEAFNDLADVLHPLGDCLGYTILDEISP